MLSGNTWMPFRPVHRWAQPHSGYSNFPPHRAVGPLRYPEREGGGVDLNEKSYLSIVDTQQIFKATVFPGKLVKEPRVWQCEKEPNRALPLWSLVWPYESNVICFLG